MFNMYYIMFYIYIYICIYSPGLKEVILTLNVDHVDL
jgi:hypothetical protein